MNALVFRIGQLGDTIVALPSFWAVRESFPDARLCLLTGHHPGQGYVPARAVVEGAGIFDEYITYEVDASAAGRLKRPWHMLGLLRRLRSVCFDALVYLAPSTRPPVSVARDRRFFRLAGVRRFVGMDGFPDLPARTEGEPLPEVPREADLLLARLAASGIPVPEPGQGRMDLDLQPREKARVDTWLAHQPSDGGRPWIAVCPGSKMPAKVWPEERYLRVVQALIDEFDVWPVVFGGREDETVGDRLLGKWQRGHNATGALGVREAAAALVRCCLYVGNDTGAMHLAAAAGVTCVAVFTSRDLPGRWYPYGRGHKVLRTQIACEGCRLDDCTERGKECIMGINVEDVGAACAAILGARRSQVTLTRGEGVPGSQGNER